jgi:hypothetical protein
MNDECGMMNLYRPERGAPKALCSRTSHVVSPMSRSLPSTIQDLRAITAPNEVKSGLRLPAHALASYGRADSGWTHL